MLTCTPVVLGVHRQGKVPPAVSGSAVVVPFITTVPIRDHLICYGCR